MTITPVMADELYERAAGYCEACGNPAVMERGYVALHHRQLKGQGGPDAVFNLMVVHHSCHNTSPWSIHSRVKRSLRLGHLVSAYENPAKVEFFVCRNITQVLA